MVRKLYKKIDTGTLHVPLKRCEKETSEWLERIPKITAAASPR